MNFWRSKFLQLPSLLCRVAFSWAVLLTVPLTARAQAPTSLALCGAGAGGLPSLWSSGPGVIYRDGKVGVGYFNQEPTAERSVKGVINATEAFWVNGENLPDYLAPAFVNEGQHNSISGSMLQSNSVNSAKIKDNSIRKGDIGSDAVGKSELIEAETGGVYSVNDMVRKRNSNGTELAAPLNGYVAASNLNPGLYHVQVDGRMPALDNEPFFASVSVWGDMAGGAGSGEKREMQMRGTARPLGEAPITMSTIIRSEGFLLFHSNDTFALHGVTAYRIGP